VTSLRRTSPRVSCGPLALAVALTACGPEFTPSTLIDKHHLLSIQAEPPEIAPTPREGEAPVAPDRTRLTALVAHPAHLTEPGHTSTVIYLACTPDPTVPGASPCSEFANIREPSALFDRGSPADCEGAATGEPGQGKLGGLSLAGVEVCDAGGCHPYRWTDPADPSISFLLPSPSYVLPSELRLDTLPPGAPARRLGIVVTLLAIGIDARPEELLAGSSDPCSALASFSQNLETLMAERENTLASKSLRVRGPDAPDAPNQNPSIVGVADGDVPLAVPGAALTSVSPGAEAELLPLLPADADLPTYTKLDASGEVLETRQERWAYSWYATEGTLSNAHTTRADLVVRWKAEDQDGHPLPTGTRVRLYTVAHDLRGGASWVVRELEVR